MKILVTGAKGQVGSEITSEGKKRGMEILATSRDELDITEYDKVSDYIKNHKNDIVINAAAYTTVDKAESEPGQAYSINRDGAANLAYACAQTDIPLIHISTDYVFDGRKSSSYTETDTPNPQSVYGKSKLEGEKAVESILEKYIILRVSWVFGANGSNFVKTMLQLAKERDVIKVVDDQHGVPTWAGDIAVTLMDLVEHWDKDKETNWGTYHYCNQPAITWKEFAETIFEQAEQLSIINQPPRGGTYY